jgi:hypothetical protein
MPAKAPFLRRKQGLDRIAEPGKARQLPLFEWEQ